MKKLLLTIIGSAYLAFTANAVQLGDKLLLSAKLTGDQEVPAVSTPAIGVASFLLNASHDSLCVNVTVTALSSAISGAHIHFGAAGVSGAVLTNLSPFISGNTIKAVITGPELSTHLKDYLSGQLYINVHTNSHTDGEIRGQILLESDWAYVTKLDGSQLVPASNTTANGLGVFNLAKDSSKIKYIVIAQGVSGAITQARINFGRKGVNGGIAIDLTPGIVGNAIAGVINNPTPALIDSLRTSKVYIDLSTAAHPNGTELRGQLVTENKYLYFDALLNGQQEVPAILTNALGVASVKINVTLDTLWYDVVSTGLSGIITGAHFHAGAPGVSGNVVVNILPGLVGNRITGQVIAGAGLSTDFIKNILKGNFYINIHTALHPDGEIRGQIARVARQGYTINLTGTQETPPVTTNAKGTGIISIDRDSENAHFMIVTDGLAGTLIHFHKQVAGQSGGVIFDLLPYYKNNAAFGYWKASNIKPFNGAIANQFNSDSIYVNVHTTLNANGEIRGQVKQNGECFNIITGIDDKENTFAEGITLYPNPVSDLVNISFNSSIQSNIHFEIVDVLGKQVFAENFIAQEGNNLHSVFVNKLKNGLYFVKIQSESGQTIERFVKK